MKILYGAVFEGNAEKGAEYWINRALNDLGHSTVCVDYRANRYNVAAQIRGVSDYDVVFIQRGDKFPLGLLRSFRAPKAFWETELPDKYRDHEKILDSGLFDHIFTWSSEHGRSLVSRNIIREEDCSIMQGAFEPGFHKRLPEVEKDIDVLFVGTITGRRAAILEKIRRHCNLQVISAFGHDMVRAINRAKIVLNIHAQNVLTTETRVYEVLGAGGFLLSEQLCRDSRFTDEHLCQIPLGDVESLLRKIKDVLARPEERSRIAQCGHQEALSKHTYAHRADQLIGTFEKYRRGEGREVLDERAFRRFARAEMVRRAVRGLRITAKSLFR